MPQYDVVQMPRMRSTYVLLHCSFVNPFLNCADNPGLVITNELFIR